MKANWTKTSLAGLQNEGRANVQTGPFGTILKASEYSNLGVPVVSVGEIRRGYLLISNRTPRVTDKIKKRLPQFVLEEGDIVFGRKGAIDRNAIVSKEQAGWFLGSDGIRLRLSESIDSVFVSYQLRSSSLGKWLLQNSSGSIMPSLNQKVLDRLPIWLPDIKEQKKIAAVLSALDAKIDCNNRINAELEAMAKTLYDYWFVQYDFPDANGKPYKSSGGKMVYNPTLKREIPAGWRDGILDDLGQIVGGSTPSTKNPENFTSDGTPWITPNDLSDNQGNKFITRGAQDVSDEGIKDASLKKYPAGTVLLSSRAPIGYMAIARTELTTNQGFKSFIPTNGYSTIFIYYTVKNSLNAITQYASGSTFKEVSATVLKTVKISLPASTSIIDEFTKSMEPIFKRQDQLEQENQHLTQLRDWLLPMLMNGQVTVV